MNYCKKGITCKPLTPIIIIISLMIACSEKKESNLIASKNSEPTASFIIDPTSGSTETSFAFFASNSIDAEDEYTELKYKWDWEDDGTWDTDYATTHRSITHQYNSKGTYIVRLEVKDTGGLTDQTTGTVTVISSYGEMTDQDGNVYTTIKIGNQWWMAENLKVTRYRNGDPITKVTDYSEWIKSTRGAYCVYNNDDSYTDIYGYLYNWFAASDSRNIAPPGWHLPTFEEWKELEIALGMSQSEASSAGWCGTNEGSKLADRTDLWSNGNLEWNSAFGESGLSALPGGWRVGDDANFSNLGRATNFWLSAQFGSEAWYWGLYYTDSRVWNYHSDKKDGFSVRLVLD